MIREEQVVVPGLQGLKGYADIPRETMQSPELEIRAKVLWLYLYSVKQDNTASPRRETIHERLALGKKAYLAAKRELCEKGYLRVEQTKVASDGGELLYSRNEFTLLLPKKKAESRSSRDLSDDEDELVFESAVHQYSYGQFPKVIFFDPRLYSKTGVNAIGLYAYLCSYGGSGTDRVAFPKTENILHDLGIARASFFAALKLLVETGYVTRTTMRKKSGKFGRIRYTITDSNQYLEELFGPVKKADSTEFKKEPTGRPAEFKKGTTGNAAKFKKEPTDRVQKRTPAEFKKEPANIINNSSLLTTHLSVNQHSDEYRIPELGREEEIDGWIREICGFDDYLVMYGTQDHAIAESAKAIITEELLSQKDVILFGKDAIPRDRFISIVARFDASTWDYVSECVMNQSRNGKTIHNLRAYLLKAIVNAPSTISSYYSLLVERDRNR